MGDPKDKSWLDKAEDYTSDSYDQQRKAIPEWDTFGRAKHDVEVGVMKGVYAGAKGLITGVIDLLILGYKLQYDPETKKKADAAVVWAAKETYKATFGSQQEIQDQNKRIIAWGDKVYEGIKKSVTDQWEEADKTEGKRTELATKWASRGVFEVALFFVGAGEAKAAVEGTSVASKLAKTERVLDAAEVGCKTIVMSNKEILAEQAARDTAAALKAAEEAKAAKDAAAAADAARAAARVEAASVAPKKRLGLGLKNKNTDYIKWSKERGYNTYSEMSGRGSFSEQIEQAMSAADEIHFNMTDLDTNKASGILNDFGEPLNRNYTNYELHLVKTNPEFRAKVVWHAADGTVKPTGWMPPGF